MNKYKAKVYQNQKDKRKAIRAERMGAHQQDQKRPRKIRKLRKHMQIFLKPQQLKMGTGK
jgi:hypothetical protein